MCSVSVMTLVSDSRNTEDAQTHIATAPQVEDYGLPVIDVQIDAEVLEEMHRDYDDDITATVSVTLDGFVRPGVKFELHGGHEDAA